MKPSTNLRVSRRAQIKMLAALAASPFVAGAPQALAQSYPSKPIRWVVPFGAGGGTDIAARTIAKYWEPIIGTNFVIDNKPGGQTIIGSQALVKSPADGYTVMSIVDNFPLLPLMFKSMPFDIERDFDFISTFAKVPMFLVVRADSPLKTFSDAVALMRKEGSKLNYGSYGLGSTPHLAMEALSAQVGATLTHIPYQGAAATMNAMIGGDLDLSFENIVTSVPFLKDGRIRVLAISSKERQKFFPDVASIHELAFPGFDYYSWQGLVAPKGLPPEVLSKLSTTFHKAMQAENLKTDFGNRGWDVHVGTPDEFKRYIASEGAKLKQLVASRNIKLSAE